MERIVWQDNRGFTLIEVMIAFVIIQIVMLGLLSVAAQVIQVSVTNIVRDEGIKVAEEVMAEVRSLPYDRIYTMTYGTLRREIDPNSSVTNVTRNFRHFTVTYNPNITVTTYADAKRVDVTVTWSYRETNYSHTISSLVRRPE